MNHDVEERTWICKICAVFLLLLPLLSCSAFVVLDFLYPTRLSCHLVCPTLAPSRSLIHCYLLHYYYAALAGTIELHELQQVMRKLGQNPTEADLIEMINSVDDNGDNEIDFEEFLVLMQSRTGERDPEKELRDAFAVFDADGSGSIDRKELKRLMKKLGQALTEAELDAMMDEVDTDGNGEISFEEFKAMMVSVALARWHKLQGG